MPVNTKGVIDEFTNQADGALRCLLPESAQEKSEAAKVIAVGSSVKEIETGQNVVYKNYAATTVKLDKEEYLIIKDEDILALVEE